MLDISLQILSVLGIILLVLLCVIVAIIFLVLFFPVSYKISGKKDAEAFWLSIKADWLFGLFRVRYAYPEPGRATVKLLWFMLYDSGVAESTTEDDTAEKKTEERSEPDSEAAVRDTVGAEENGQTTDLSETQAEESTEKNGENNGEDSEGISKKIEKIKFTIYSTYDKIKKIWQNISYYVILLQEEETHQLFSHAMNRLGRVFKHIRPRKFEAEIVFGTGAPDTTGYAYGVYGMLSPTLGPGVVVTPDFVDAVFEGKFDSTGYITSAVLAWQFLKVILDRRLWRFWDKLKTGRGSDDGATVGADRGNNPQDGGADVKSET